MVVPIIRQPCLDALLLGLWRLADIAASVLLRGCAHVPGIVHITGIKCNVLSMFSLLVLGGWLMLSHSTFVLLARRGIVLAEIRNVATTLGYHVV